MEPLILLKIAVFLAIGLIIAFNDIKYKKIPNWSVILMFFSGLAINFSDFNLTQLLLVMAISYFAWRVNYLGAGDAKLMIAIQSFMNFENLTFILYAIIGAIIFYFVISIDKIKSFKLRWVDLKDYVIFYFPLIIIIKIFTQDIFFIILALIMFWQLIKKVKEIIWISRLFTMITLIMIIISIYNSTLINTLQPLMFIVLITISEKYLEHIKTNIKFGPFLILGGLL